MYKDRFPNYSKLNASSNGDYYGLSNKDVKGIIKVIVEPKTYLYNMMLEQGPSALK